MITLALGIFIPVSIDLVLNVISLVHDINGTLNVWISENKDGIKCTRSFTWYIYSVLVDVATLFNLARWTIIIVTFSGDPYSQRKKILLT